MAGVRGKTNNPNGRPPKNQALTDMLKKQMSKRIELPDGRKVSGKTLISEMVMRVLASGRLRFPDDTEDSIISVKDWLDFVKWAYERVDGKPVQPIGGEADDGSIVLKVVYEKQKESQPDA